MNRIRPNVFATLMRYAPLLRPRELGRIALLLTGVAGCGSSLPSVPLAPPLQSTYVLVPYPPPPGRLEYVPKAPRKDALWIDGQWNWLSERWIWSAGGWVVVPSGVKFSPWRTVRRADGELFFSPAQWVDSKGNAVAAPPIVLAAQTTAAAPVAPEQVSAEPPVHGPDLPGHGTTPGSTPTPKPESGDEGEP